MELSINFIVMLILTIAVFSFGIKFAYDIFTRSQNYAAEIDENTRNQIEAKLYEGSIISIPINEKTIKIKGTDVFGLGILNQLGDTKNFVVFITFSGTAVDPNGNALDVGTIDITKWTTMSKSRVYEIKNNGFEIINILFSPPVGTKKGTYVFNVNVCYDISSGTVNDKCSVHESGAYPYLYDYTHQIRIEVI